MSKMTTKTRLEIANAIGSLKLAMVEPDRGEQILMLRNASSAIKKAAATISALHGEPVIIDTVGISAWPTAQGVKQNTPLTSAELEQLKKDLDPGPKPKS